MKKSAKLNSLIESFKEESTKLDEQLQKLEILKETIKKDIDAAKAELEQLFTAVIDDPNETNRKAEAEVRAKITELENELDAAEDKKRHVTREVTQKRTQIAHKAVEVARADAQKFINENVEAAKKAIEDAKYTYLKALVDYHDIGKQARKHFHDIQKEMQTQYMTGSEPEIPELHLLYTGGYKQLYGVLDKEMLDALQRGIIRKTSVADGREINDTLYS